MYIVQWLPKFLSDCKTKRVFFLKLIYKLATLIFRALSTTWNLASLGQSFFSIWKRKAKLPVYSRTISNHWDIYKNYFIKKIKISEVTGNVPSLALLTYIRHPISVLLKVVGYKLVLIYKSSTASMWHVSSFKTYNVNMKMHKIFLYCLILFSSHGKIQYSR